MKGLSVAEQMYDHLIAWVQRLFRLRPLAHQTPFEYAGEVNRAMGRQHSAVERVAAYYVMERFGGRTVADGRARQAWGQARPILWRSWLQHRVEAVKRLWRRLAPPEE
jgi:hypothetical protein